MHMHDRNTYVRPRSIKTIIYTAKCYFIGLIPVIRLHTAMSFGDDAELKYSQCCEEAVKIKQAYRYIR